jgi:hypothetical protein
LTEKNPAFGDAVATSQFESRIDALFALFSSFDGDWQSASFLIQRHRDKLSTRKFDVGVFTQPGPTADAKAAEESCLILKDKGRRYHTLISAILGPSFGVHFSLECFVIGLLARAFAAWRPRGDVKRGTNNELDDDDQPFF